MKYAVIDIPSSEVVNIILWDGVAPLSLPFSLVPIGDLPCDIGWTWNGAEFLRPTE